MKFEIDQEDFNQRLQLALEGSAIEIQESLKDKLTKEHGKDLGILQSSIRVTVNDGVIEISMDEHGKYVEWGTAPHFPPVKDLVGWVKRKWGGSDKEAMQKAWMLAYSISKRGTRPYPFIRPTFQNDIIPIIRRNLINAFK